MYSKNPAYGRHQLSRPMRIVEPIQIWRAWVIFLFFSHHHQGRRVDQWEAGIWSCDLRTKKNYMKRGHQRKKQGNKERNKHTLRLLDQLGPEGRVGENHTNMIDFLYASLFYRFSLGFRCITPPPAPAEYCGICHLTLGSSIGALQNWGK